jgi:hypothetical protein
MSEVLIPQVEMSSFPVPIVEDRLAEELVAALDDDCRSDVIAIMARLDDATRQAILDAVDELDGVGADMASLLAIFKGKPHRERVSEGTVSTMRRLFETVRESLGSGSRAGARL